MAAQRHTWWRLAAAPMAVAALSCCDDDPQPAPPTPGKVLSIGRPTAPRPVRVPLLSTVELRAAGPGRTDGPTWVAIVARRLPRRPRDVCIATGIAGQDLAEANTGCEVLVPGYAASMVRAAGVPDRYGPGPTVISGVAPPGVRSVRLSGPGGTHVLPLSAHRGFLAVYSARHAARSA